MTDELAAELRRDYTKAPLSPADRAMLDFVVKLTRTPYKHTSADVEKLRAAGFDDTGILQITMIAAYFNYINRVADALGVGKPVE
ncbi:carboxymuconolactone decarboxylase family protein [Gemmata massiliana]|nr:peroxidase [Gemmata massiliana]